MGGGLVKEEYMECQAASEILDNIANRESRERERERERERQRQSQRAKETTAHI